MRLSRNGLTLVEILVGLALLSMSALSVVYLSQLVGNQSKNDRINSTANLIDSLIVNRLKYANLCADSLREPVVSDPNLPLKIEGGATEKDIRVLVPNIRGSVLSSILSKESQYNKLPLHNLRIEKMNLTHILSDGNLPSDVRIAYLETEYSYINAENEGARVRSAKIIKPLSLKLNLAGEVIECYASGGGQSQVSLCNMVGGADTNGLCRVPVAGFDCPAGMAAVEVLDGEARCEWIGTGGCPDGYLMSSISVGSQVCRKVPL